MENVLFFNSEKEVRFGKLLRYIIPTYLTSLFNTVYTIIDGIFVSAYVGTNALAAINIVYPIVNVLTGIALIFATGGSAVAALHIGGNRKNAASRSFSVSVTASILLGSLVSLGVFLNLTGILNLLGATSLTMNDCKIYALWWLLGTPVVIGKELFTYFIRVDGNPAYSFAWRCSKYYTGLYSDWLFKDGNSRCGACNDAWSASLLWYGTLLLLKKVEGSLIYTARTVRTGSGALHDKRCIRICGSVGHCHHNHHL